MITSALTPDGGLINGVGPLTQGAFHGQENFTMELN